MPALTAREKYSHKHASSPYCNFLGEMMTSRTWSWWMASILREAARVCRDGSPVAVFCDWRQIPNLIDAFGLGEVSVRGVAVWHKTNNKPRRGAFGRQPEFVVWGSKGRLAPGRIGDVCLPSVWSTAIVSEKHRYHLTQKPVSLMREIVKIVEPGGMILDPFAGSGTTLIAAVLEGRKAIGIEYSKEIAEVARQRIERELQTNDS